MKAFQSLFHFRTLKLLFGTPVNIPGKSFVFLCSFQSLFKNFKIILKKMHGVNEVVHFSSIQFRLLPHTYPSLK